MILKAKIGVLKRALIGIFHNIFQKYPTPPNSIRNEFIGESHEKRPIELFRLGKESEKILWVAGIHGNEVGTVKLAYKILCWLASQYFENLSLYIIPCLNPDGYELAKKNPDYLSNGRIGRFNKRGVDLNRNFDTPSFQKKSMWSHGKNYSLKTEVYCGEHGNSEPETTALINFIKNENIKTLFMLHNAGCDVMGNKNALSQKITRLYGEKTGFRYVDEDEWKTFGQTGTAKEWCDLNDVAYIEIEGSTRWGSDWNRQKEAIEAVLVLLNSGLY